MTSTSHRLFIVSLSALLGLTACPSSEPKGDSDVAEVEQDIAEDVAEETAPDTAPECTQDADCTPSSPCMIAACVGNLCLETEALDGSSCSDSPGCSASCSGGLCGAPVPETTCDGRTCGTDSCGTSCGTCLDGQTCDDATGTCTAADPCNGITYDGCCTADGVAQWCDTDDEGQSYLASYDCGGIGTPAHWCGWTDNLGYYCDDRQQTDPGGLPLLCPGESCTKACSDADVQCGYLCGEDCGSCTDGAFCNAEFQCETCAPDHCGGGCGDCATGFICDSGTCVPDMCALGDDGTGCCQGTIVVWCSQGSPAALDCGSDGCGWDASNAWHDCGFTGTDPGGTPYECVGPTTVEPGPEVAEVVEQVEGPADAGADAAEVVETPVEADAGGTDTTSGDAGAGGSNSNDLGPGPPDSASGDASSGDMGPNDAG